jgi:hypothetical protein
MLQNSSYIKTKTMLGQEQSLQLNDKTPDQVMPGQGYHKMTENQRNSDKTLLQYKADHHKSSMNSLKIK